MSELIFNFEQTLQALLACPPFYNLMRDISETPNVFREATSTPIIDNLSVFIFCLLLL